MARLRIRTSIIVTTAIQAAFLKALANITAQVAAAWQQGAFSKSAPGGSLAAAATAHGLMLDWGRVAEFSTYGFVSASLGFIWQYVLEHYFPTQLPAPHRTGGIGVGTAAPTGHFRRRSSPPPARRHHDPDDPEKRGRNSISGGPFSPTTITSPVSATSPTWSAAAAAAQTLPTSSAPTVTGGGISWRNVTYKMVLDQTIWLLLTTTIFIVFTNALRVNTDVLWQIWREKCWYIIKAAWHVWPLVAICNFAFVPVDYRVLVAACVGFAWAVFLSLVSLTTTPAVAIPVAAAAGGGVGGKT